MSSVGRNDPCGCGSGRKFKHCCLATANVAHDTRRRMREAEGRLIPLLWHMALETWRQAGLDEAYDTFFMDAPCPDDILEHRDHESLFLTWFALRFAPKPLRGGAAPSAAARLLADHQALAAVNPEMALSDFERRFLAAAEAASPSFYAVTGVSEGASIDLEDILTGSTCRVLETTASRIVRRGHVIYARVATADGVSIMVGSGTTPFPPTRRGDLADVRATLARGGSQLTPSDLRRHEDLLRRWYLLAADQQHNPPPPKFTNTDGDPLAPTTLSFTLSCTPAEAFAALKSLSVTQSDEDDILEEAERDADGALASFSIDWMKRGNRLHRDWDNTVLGHIDVRERTLTATVNSSRRASRLRKQIEKRLAGRVRFDRTVIESVDALLEQARASGPPPQPDVPPGILAEFQRAHWAAWLDESIPALKGDTPRAAAATPAGRERLEALLTEFEWSGDVPVPWLRAELKL